MYEVLCQTFDRRSLDSTGTSLTFKHSDHRAFQSLKEAREYAFRLSVNLRYTDNVYIVDKDKDLTIERYVYTDEKVIKRAMCELPQCKPRK